MTSLDLALTQAQRLLTREEVGLLTQDIGRQLAPSLRQTVVNRIHPTDKQDDDVSIDMTITPSSRFWVASLPLVLLDMEMALSWLPLAA